MFRSNAPPEAARARPDALPIEGTRFLIQGIHLRMPDPWRYLSALALTGLVAASVVFASRRLLPSLHRQRAALLAIAMGIDAGLSMLRLPPHWPPITGLDRLLLGVLPAIFLVEWWAAGCVRHAPKLLLARLAVLACAGPLLLWNSVHLAAELASIAGTRSFATIATSILLVVSVGLLFRAAEHRAPELASRVGPALGLSILAAGVLTLLGGYVRGGVTFLVLGTAYLSTAFIETAAERTSAPMEHDSNAGFQRGPWLGLGLILLHGVLFVGIHFGRLPHVHALVLLLAPCLAVAIDTIPPLRRLPASARYTLGLLAVAVPLALLAVAAKDDFDRRMGPMLGMPAAEPRPPQTTTP